MKNTLKQIIKTQTYLNACLYIIYNMRIRLQGVCKNWETDSGTTHEVLSIQESLQYIEDVMWDYKRISGQSQFQGKVAELGPGDSSGVGLMFLAHGADQVDLADRFYSRRNSQKHQKIYEALFDQYPVLKGIDPEDSEKLKRYYGPEASGETFFDHHQGYDTIISRSVLEHVDDPALVLRKMFRALKPAGMLLHKVDLRDHGMFAPYGHALKFFEIPQWLYRCMTYGVGYPNRFLFHEYKRVLTELDPNCEFYVSGLHGVEKDMSKGYPFEKIPDALKKQSVDFVDSHRSKFARALQHVASEDLIVSSFFFVCRK